MVWLRYSLRLTFGKQLFLFDPNSLVYHWGCATMVDGVLYCLDGIVPTYNFQRVSLILDHLNGEILDRLYGSLDGSV